MYNVIAFSHLLKVANFRHLLLLHFIGSSMACC